MAWDSGKWDGAIWEGGPPPTGHVGTDWSVWYQAGPTVDATMADLAPLLVEARWTTEGHTMGDGSYRGDLQPGSCTVQFNDPGRVLDKILAISYSGSLWLLYKPTGACWCFFYSSFARTLYPAGDPLAADCVFTGSTWPLAWTNNRTQTNFNPSTVKKRFDDIVYGIGVIFAGQYPPLTGSAAAQNQSCGAAAADSSTGTYPGYLQAVRDAGADGVAWLAASAPAGGPGQLILCYERWETIGQHRPLGDAQIVAGPPSTADATWAISFVQWTATVGTTAAASTLNVQASPGFSVNGKAGPSFRLWGDVTASGPEQSACNQIAQNLFADYAQGDLVLSSVSLQSGHRTTATGGTALADWDPYAHVFRPTDLADINDINGHPVTYRITLSSHRLTFTIWQTVHTLEKYSPAVALPP